MPYRIGADLVLLAHFTFVGFAVLGGFLNLVNHAWVWTHLAVVVWSSVVNLAGWTCPLTPLEKFLRQRAGGAGYEGGFVRHYIGPLVYPRGMPRRLELVAGVSIVAWNGLVYAVALPAVRSLRTG
jgi:hypothetical protein